MQGLILLLVILFVIVVFPYLGLLCIETIFKIPMSYSWQELLAMAGLLFLFGGAAFATKRKSNED